MFYSFFLPEEFIQYKGTKKPQRKTKIIIIFSLRDLSVRFVTLC
jgi:hypothetical protein